MLEKILEHSKLPPGAIRVAAWLLGVNGGAPIRRTVEKLAADAGCDKRSLLDAVRNGQLRPGAIALLAEVGLPIHIDAGEVVFAGTADSVPTVRHSFAAVMVETATVAAPISEEECERRKLRKSGIYEDCVQLTFDEMDAPVFRRDVGGALKEKYPTMQTAALRLPKAPVERSLCNDCATSAQPLHDDCTTVAQSALSDVQKALFDRIQQRLSEKPAVSNPQNEKKSDPSLNPINQELINPIIPTVHTIPKPINQEIHNSLSTAILSLPADMPDQTAAVWSQARYGEYLDDIRRRFPAWSKKIYNPETQRWGTCEWAVKRLAAIMAWGAPPAVYNDVMEFVTSSNPETRARNPSFAFLWKVSEASRKWKFSKR